MRACVKSMVSGSEYDHDSKVVIEQGKQTLVVDVLTWHKPGRLDGFVSEFNALCSKYGLMKESE